MTSDRRYDVVVVGAGLNGLVAGAWLARQKRSVLVLDARPEPGGAAVTTDIVPGFRAPTLSHALGPIAPQVLEALGLGVAGLDLIAPDPALVTVGQDGESVAFHADTARTRASIAGVSPADADRWPAFTESVGRIAGLAARMAAEPPPAIDGIAARDVLRLLRLGREARRLDRADLARAVRYVPMAVGDLVGEWFEHDLVRAAISAHALFGNHAGPRSAGTGGYLLQRLAADPFPVGRGITARGGPGAVARLIADHAAAAGATLRAGARVAGIVVEGSTARGVMLEDGGTIEARAVLGAIDPRQLFLSLVGPAALPPTFVERIRHYRARGVTAKINLALSSPPRLARAEAPFPARLLVAPGLEYLERAHDDAKYGRVSESPWLELAVPTFADASLAPAGGHVMSICVHVAPRDLRQATWPEAGEDCYRAAMRALEPVVPGLDALVVGREIITPADLEQRWGLSGGHIFHGEPAMDQTWVARPLLGWSRYATPVTGLFAGGAGTHPGGGLTGLSGLHAARAVHASLSSRSDHPDRRPD